MLKSRDIKKIKFKTTEDKIRKITTLDFPKLVVKTKPSESGVSMILLTKDKHVITIKGGEKRALGSYPFLKGGAYCYFNNALYGRSRGAFRPHRHYEKRKASCCGNGKGTEGKGRNG